MLRNILLTYNLPYVILFIIHNTEVQLKSLYRHKSKKSIDKKQLTKKLNAEKMREKYFATSYGRTVQKAMDNGAKFTTALKLANALLRHQPSFGMQRSIYGKVKTEVVKNVS